MNWILQSLYSMVHLNISHQDYDTATQLLLEANPDLSKIDVEIDFGTDHSQSKIIRDFVWMIFDAHAIGSPWRGRFILIADELINNAIEHGSAAGDIDGCIIRAWKGSDENFSITLEVHDTGRGKDSEKAKNMIQIRNELKKDDNEVYMEKRGRWLFYITEKLVDHFEFLQSPRGGLAVRVEKTIGRE